MKNLSALAASLPLALALASGAAAQDSVPWRIPEVGGWIVSIDKSLGGNGGCFVLTEFDGNAVLRIGFDPQSSGYYALLGDTDWTSIQDGSVYDLVMQFGGQPIWNAPSTGGRMGDLPTLLVTTSDPNFVNEFAGQPNVRVTFNGNEIANLSLQGSSRAVSEMLTCQDEMNRGSGGTGGADPFSTGGGGTSGGFSKIGR